MKQLGYVFFFVEVFYFTSSRFSASKKRIRFKPSRLNLIKRIYCKINKQAIFGGLVLLHLAILYNDVIIFGKYELKTLNYHAIVS